MPILTRGSACNEWSAQWKPDNATSQSVATQTPSNLWLDALRHLLEKRSAVVGLSVLLGLG